MKTKEHLRSTVWWPGIDRHAKKQHRECFGCQLVNKHVLPPLIKPTRLPDRAWQEIALDLPGPLPGGEYLLVVVDYFSKWQGKGSLGEGGTHRNGCRMAKHHH